MMEMSGIIKYAKQLQVDTIRQYATELKAPA